jgi:hypothetical protein
MPYDKLTIEEAIRVDSIVVKYGSYGNRYEMQNELAQLILAARKPA